MTAVSERYIQVRFILDKFVLPESQYDAINIKIEQRGM